MVLFTGDAKKPPPKGGKEAKAGGGGKEEKKGKDAKAPPKAPSQAQAKEVGILHNPIIHYCYASCFWTLVQYDAARRV